MRRLPKEMKAEGAQDYEAGDITALPFDTPEEEAQHIAGRAKRCVGVAIREDGEDAASRCRTWRYCCASVRRDGGPITAALDAAGVPYVITGMDNLFETAEAEAARQLFYFLAGEIDEEALLAAWKAADLGLAPRT